MLQKGNNQLSQILNKDNSVLQLENVMNDSLIYTENGRASQMSSIQFLLDNDTITTNKYNTMVTQLEGSKFTTEKLTDAKNKQNAQKIARPVQNHILLLNTGREIDLTKSNLISRSVPRGVHQFKDQYQQLIKRTLVASNTENVPNFDALSQRSDIRDYLRSGSVDIRNKARQEAQNLSTLSRAVIQRNYTRRLSAVIPMPSLQQSPAISQLIMVPSIQQETVEEKISSYANSERKNQDVSTLMQDIIEDKKTAIKKILGKMQKTALIEQLAQEDINRPTSDNSATLFGHAQRHYSTKELLADYVDDEDVQDKVEKKQVNKVQKSDWENEYEQQILAEQARLDERKAHKLKKEAEKQEQRRIRRANLPVLSKDEMEAEIKKYYQQLEEQKNEQNELTLQEKIKKERNIIKGKIKVKTKQIDLESVDKNSQLRDSAGASSFNRSHVEFNYEQESGIFQRKSIVGHQEVQSKTQEVFSGEKDINFWQQQAQLYKPQVPEPSEKSDTHYSMHSMLSTFQSPEKLKRPFQKQQSQVSSPKTEDAKFEPIQEENENSGKEEEQATPEEQQEYEAQAQVQEADQDDIEDRQTMKKNRKKQQEKYQLEMCGKEFLGKIQEMLDSYNPELQYGQNYGNNQQMVKSGSQNQLELESNVNNETAVTLKVMEDFSQVLKQQAAFFIKCKNALLPKFEGQTDENASFFKLCEQERVLVFPVFSKIINQSLLVKYQKLHTGVCIAMKGVLTLMPNMLTKIFLDSNGLQGSDLSIIVEGLLSQVQLKTITIQNNEIDDNCVKYLGKFLERRMPYNVSELNIYHCRISWKQTSDLLKLIKTRNQLNKLSLVKANINEMSIQSFEKILKSKNLVNLDISWNSLTPRAFKGFLENLSTNRNLQYINLAWNNLSDVQATLDDQKTTLNSLGQMIKHNKNLLHMDLTSTGLGSFIVQQIGTCLRRARSILCIHLSGNPGMTAENFQFLKKRIRCRPNEDMARFLKIETLISEMTKDFPVQYYQSIQAKMKRESEFTPMDFQPIGLVSDKIILQRILGFKENMPGSAQWYESSTGSIPTKKHYKHSCWICEGHIYSIIFWSKGRACRLNPIFKNEEAEPLRWEVDNIPQEQIDDPGLGHVAGAVPYDQLEDRVPYLAGSFTGWRYKKMIPLHLLTKSIDKEYSTPLELCKYKGQIRKKISDLDLLEPRELAHLEVAKVLENQRYRKDWSKYFKYLPFKHPYLINGTYFEGIDDDTDVLDLDETDQLLNELSSEEESPQPQVKQVKKKQQKSDLDLDDSTMMREEPMPVPPDPSKWDIVYVLPIFVKPGKHTYLVKQKDSNSAYFKQLLKKRKRLEMARDGTLDMSISKNKNVRWNEKRYQEITSKIKPQTYVYKCQVLQRNEPIPIHAKQMTSKVVERTYDKIKSVFKEWKQDTPETLQNMVTFDLAYWKIDKFVKQAEDLTQCAKIILNHAAFLKDCFLSITCQSAYPAFTSLDYGLFTQKCGINDNVNVNGPAVDRTFIAANIIKQDKERFNPVGNSLCRYEFFEALVRLSQLKYKDTGIVKTFPEALEMLIVECLLKNASPEPWQQFRDQELWKLDVNDVLEANLEGLKKVYNFYTNQNKKFLNIDDCVNICMREAPSLSMLEKDVRIAYAMCKMTVVNEPVNYKSYNTLLFVEFLEFIGRLAHYKFKGTQESQLPLATKIEVVLDEIMLAFGMTRNEVNIAVEEFSESDDDY